MEFQFMVMVFALTTLCGAHPSSIVAPVAAPIISAPVIAAKLADAEFDPNPQYAYAYDVHDVLTGDSKSQSESRNGGLVQGRYTVADPDGTRRIVDYTADPVNGFNAVVSKVPQAVAAPIVTKAAPARVVAAAPAPLVAAAPAPLVAPSLSARIAYAPAASPLAYSAALPAPLVTAPAVSPYSIARVAYASPYAVY